MCDTVLVMKKQLIAVRLRQSDVAFLKQLATIEEKTVSELIRDVIGKTVENFAENKEFQKRLRAELRKKKGKKQR